MGGMQVGVVLLLRCVLSDFSIGVITSSSSSFYFSFCSSSSFVPLSSAAVYASRCCCCRPVHGPPCALCQQLYCPVLLHVSLSLSSTPFFHVFALVLRLVTCVLCVLCVVVLGLFGLFGLFVLCASASSRASVSSNPRGHDVILRMLRRLRPRGADVADTGEDAAQGGRGGDKREQGGQNADEDWKRQSKWCESRVDNYAWRSRRALAQMPTVWH